MGDIKYKFCYFRIQVGSEKRWQMYEMLFLSIYLFLGYQLCKNNAVYTTCTALQLSVYIGIVIIIQRYHSFLHCRYVKKKQVIMCQKIY